MSGLAAVFVLATTCAFAQEAGVPDDVRREWTVREWALSPAQYATEIEAAGRSEDWRERYMAVDALGRSYAGARWVEKHDAYLLSALLADAHPNVRSAALRVIEYLDDAPETARRRLLELAQGTVREPLAEVAPAVREALARALAAAPCLRPPRATGADAEVALEALLALARADPGRAGHVAARELATLGPEADSALVTLLLAEYDERGEAAWVEALPLMIRAVHGPAVASALRARVADERAGARTLAEAFALHMELRLAPGATLADREVLAAGWLADRQNSRRRELLIETARLGDAGLGEALMRQVVARQAAGLGADDDGTTFLVECAAMSLEPGVAAERALALALEPDLATLVWAELATRPYDWTLEDVRPWLADSFPADLREHVVSVSAGSRPEVPSGEGDRIVLAALRDPDPALRASAFRWSVRRVHSEDYLDEQFAAWRTLEPDIRLELLRDLPRSSRPVAFRAALLELARERETRTASVVELLATFVGDNEVATALTLWFEWEVVELERRPEAGAFREHELRAGQLARAQLALRGEAAAPLLDDALRRTLHLEHAPRAGGERELRPILPKVLAGVLASSASGRERLAHYLADETPRRVRIEAALGLLGTPVVHRSAAAVLRADYAGCDTVLRQRILKALGRAVDPPNADFLAGVVRDERAPLEQRVTAIDALVERDARVALGELLHAVQDAEVRLAIIAHGFASARLLERARAVAWIEDESRAREVLALQAAHPRLVGEFPGDLLRRPLAGAARDLDARFDGPGGASAAAHWAPELALARVLAGSMPDAFADALAGCGPWWRLEPELLGLLAQTAREECGTWVPRSGSLAEAAEHLCQAALVALDGEVPGEGTEGNYLRLYLLAMDLAQHREDWSALAYWADRAQHFARLRPGTFRALETQMGDVDRRAGVDPWARLASAREQARAWAAERADRERYRARARARLGFSQAANEAQERLERER